jgi:hypothetical protein
MTTTLDGVTSKRKDKPGPATEQKVAEELVRRAREQGLSLAGRDGLGDRRPVRVPRCGRLRMLATVPNWYDREVGRPAPHAGWSMTVIAARARCLVGQRPS